jgi:hypothetical protein
MRWPSKYRLMAEQVEERAMPSSLRRVLVVIALMCPGSSASADVITDWDQKAIEIVAPGMPSTHSQRIVAIMHAAMFDALNSIERRYQPYIAQLPASPTTSKDAAAAVAAATVLTKLLSGSGDELKVALATYLARLPDNEAKSDGIKLGQAVAGKILEARAGDGADSPDAYRPKTSPGVYVPTPITVASMWPNVTPFALKSPSQFRPGPPPPLGSEQWATDYNEIKDLGGKASTKRSARQTEDARFWLVTGPPAYHPIARQLVVSKKMDVMDSARFMALVAMAEADAYIAVMDGKYHYDFWRPITAIRNGNLSGNPAVSLEAAWQPIDSTPLHPEYPCAHCICGATLAAVVETLFDTADVAEVTMTSATAPGVSHRWTNLWAVSKEVSEARIWAGFHYRFSTRAGEDMGRKVGQYVAANILKRAKVADAR